MSMFGSVHGPSAKPKLTIPNKNVNHMPGVRQFDLLLLTLVRTVFSTWKLLHEVSRKDQPIKIAECMRCNAWPHGP